MGTKFLAFGQAQDGVLFLQTPVNDRLGGRVFFYKYIA